MILPDEMVKKLENERDSWSMRAFSEDNSQNRSDYLTGYYLGFANGLSRALEEIRLPSRKGKGRRKKENPTVLRLI